MDKEYDIVVVGAGPAGSVAARWAGEKGIKVALLEKDGEIGIPVRCAEATSEVDLVRLIGSLHPSWVASYGTRARLFAPSLEYVEMPLPTRGVILNRRIFDSDLAAEAAKVGVEVYTKAYVSQVDFSNSQPIVTVQYRGEIKKIKAKIVIAADGVESRVARWAGIKTQTVLKDIESCAQFLMGNINTETDCIDFYFSSRWAPGGYAWVFPKGDHKANVGLGVNCAKKSDAAPIELLENFCQTLFPKAVRLATVVGGVPVAKSLAKIAADNLLIVGDAARQVNPVSGGGILAALTAGQMAGKVAAQAIRKGDYSFKSLKKYQLEWDKTVGRDYQRFYQIKEWMITLTDDDLNNICRSIKTLKPDEINLFNVFRVALRDHPKLLWLAVKLFAQYK